MAVIPKFADIERFQNVDQNCSIVKCVSILGKRSAKKWKCDLSKPMLRQGSRKRERGRERERFKLVA